KGCRRHALGRLPVLPRPRPQRYFPQNRQRWPDRQGNARRPEARQSKWRAPCRSRKQWRRIRPDRTRSSRDDAALEAFADRLFGQFAADEDEAALAGLAVFPRPLVVALQHHVHALEDVAVFVVAESKNTLRAQDFLTLARHQVLQPWHEF